MDEVWRLILLITPLIAGGISIYFSFRLMKRYKISFTSSFFYYMVFLYIFGTYSLAGAGILEHLLTRMEIDQKVIHSARLYAIFLGISCHWASQPTVRGMANSTGNIATGKPIA